MKSRQPKCALLMIDVLNDFLFPGSEKLLRYARPAARRLALLRRRLKSRGIPVIYVNDNFGRWQSDFKEQIARCTDAECPGHEVASLLLPEADDYFVLKPKHSGFYSTSLEVLIGYLGVRELILTGFAGTSAFSTPPMTLICGTSVSLSLRIVSLRNPRGRIASHLSR